ncbi:hypothetical protein EVAR_67776_1 [Eumeta japonica]|uniref:Uncharacterized protein n=1 Tax=Eumeta variegata TaxID=151549 RepID=A0A4C1ZWH9_EUMVA|nr:hypothetical protein EVAR_67776_1 [Eumeta japonica]
MWCVKGNNKHFFTIRISTCAETSLPIGRFSFFNINVYSLPHPENKCKCRHDPRTERADALANVIKITPPETTRRASAAGAPSDPARAGADAGDGSTTTTMASYRLGRKKSIFISSNLRCYSSIHPNEITKPTDNH